MAAGGYDVNVDMNIVRWRGVEDDDDDNDDDRARSWGGRFFFNLRSENKVIAII